MKPQIDKNYRLPAKEEELAFGSGEPAGVLPTGNAGWRTFRPVIDHANCIRCLFCYVYCPDGVIGKEEKELTIDYDFCKGCGVCANECPKKAITMVKEGEA